MSTRFSASAATASPRPAPARTTDGDRPVLGRELAARVEPPHPDGRDRRGTRPLGERTTVRPAEPGDDGRLHRHLRHQVPLPLLAAGDRHPARRHRRQPGDDRRPDVDSAGPDATDPGLRLRARRRRRSRGAGPEAVLQDRQDELLGLQLHAARRTDVQRRLADAASLHQLLPGGRRERGLPHLRRASTSATRSRRGRGTARRSATGPSTTSSGPCTAESTNVGGPVHFGRARPLVAGV